MSAVPLALFVAFIVVPLVELWVILQVGSLIGAVPTIILLVADSLLGAWLVRREGRRAWDSLRTAFASGRWPADEVTQGGLVIFGGALLLTPGFVTDAVGLLSVLPPTRAMMSRLLRRWTSTWAGRRMGGASVFVGGDPAGDRRDPSVGGSTRSTTGGRRQDTPGRRRPANDPRARGDRGRTASGSDTPDVEVLGVERDVDEG